MNRIKRFSLVMIALLFAVGVSHAQFRFGVKAGLNLSNLHLENTNKTFSKDNKCGYTVGVMTEFQVPIVGLCLDASLMFTHMNADVEYYTEAGTNGSQPIPVTMEANSNGSRNFFQIPINVKYKFQIPVIASAFTPYLFTGPDFAFKLGGKNDVFKTKTFQCAWNVGVGFELLRHLQIQGSYGFGMNNVFDKVGIADLAGINTSGDFKAKNNYWTVTAAYLF